MYLKIEFEAVVGVIRPRTYEKRSFGIALLMANILVDMQYAEKAKQKEISTTHVKVLELICISCVEVAFTVVCIFDPLPILKPGCVEFFENF